MLILSTIFSLKVGLLRRFAPGPISKSATSVLEDFDVSLMLVPVLLVSPGAQFRTLCVIFNTLNENGSKSSTGCMMFGK